MGGRGASFGSAEYKIRETLKNEENKIRNLPVEHASVIGKDGTVIFTKSENKADEVNFTTKEASMFKDNVFTHNHPNGSLFSSDDINLAFVTALKEMRACHANGYYSLERQFNVGANVPQKYFNFSSDYEQAIANYKTNVTDKEWASSKQTSADADRLNKKVHDFMADWLKKNAMSYGWKFTEGKT